MHGLAGSWKPQAVVVAAVIASIGTASSFVAPYLSLYINKTLAATPTEFAAYLLVTSIATVLASVYFGLRSDRTVSRKNLVLATLGIGAIGYALAFVMQSLVSFFLVSVFFFSIGSTAVSQVFAIGRSIADQTQSDNVDLLNSLYRATFSIAWIVGPIAAAILVTFYSVPATFLASSLLTAIALFATAAADLPTLRVVSKSEGGETSAPEHPRLSIADVGAVVALFGVLNVAMVGHSALLPLLIVDKLRGNDWEVGLTSSLAAACEVPFMFGWALVCRILSRRAVLSTAGVLYGIYLLLVTWAPTIEFVLVLQVLNALAMAAVFSVGLGYCQDVIAGRVGFATAMYSVAGVLGALGASLIISLIYAGNLMDRALLTCAALSLLSGLMFAIGPNDQQKRARVAESGADLKASTSVSPD